MSRIIGRLDIHARETLRGFSFAFAVRIAGLGFSFLLTVWIARMLGAAGAGMFALAATCVGIACIVARLGLDNALLRFVAESVAADNFSRAAGAARKGLFFAALAAGTASVLVYLGSESLAALVFHEPGLTLPLKIMALAIVPITLFTLYGQLLQSVKKTGWSTFIQTASLPLLSLCGLALLVPTALFPASIELVAIVTVLAAALTLLAAWRLWRRAAPWIRQAPTAFSSAELLGASLPLLWVASMDLVIGWTDTVMLGVFSDSRSVGIYHIASRTAMIASLMLVAANTITAPKFAAFHAIGDVANLQRIAQLSARLVTIATLPILVVFVFAPSYVLAIFGAEFRAGGPALAVLSIAQLVNVLSGSVVILLVMTGRQRAVSLAMTVAAVGNVALNWALIPPLGYLGACIATAISMSLINLVLVWVVWRELGLVSAVFPTGRIAVREVVE